VTDSQAHPLDPLTADEIRRVAAVLRREGGVGAGWRFASIELREPGKAALGEGDAIDREAIAVCWDRADGRAYRAVVSLAGDAVTGWEYLPGQQPNMTVDEWHECDEMLRAHPALAEALARRGITDLSLVLTDMWAYGAALVPERYRGMRIGWSDVWYRDSPDGNPYAHHVTGLHPVVDLNGMTLLEIEDLFDGSAAQAEVRGEYLPTLTGLPLREVAPLEVRQPSGAGFTLSGRLLSWQNWRLRLGFNHREGLVLHQVGFVDGGRLRPVAHRLSFAEMFVPYRDASPDHYRRTAFDIGEWGLGFMTTSLELGCDCLGEISYLDAVVHDSAGEPRVIRNAICVHEEDSGVLWKHVDERTGAAVRRQRRLVISFHVTVANYEYLVYWRFYQDGNIECEVRATGIVVTSHVSGPGLPAHGTVVDQDTYAPFHQHFIVARLDLDVDGPANTVYAVSSEAVADDAFGLGLVVREVPLRTEAEGKQDYDWSVQRGWKVVNESVLNGLGSPVGYKLVPSGAFPALLPSSSPAFLRAEVIGHTLWVTPHHPDERWPCGDFPNLSSHDEGLPRWTAADRPIENTDVVLWYVFGIHHITRPEDWPVMPTDAVSFWLKPFGFFDRNPALDVPPGHLAVVSPVVLRLVCLVLPLALPLVWGVAAIQLVVLLDEGDVLEGCLPHLIEVRVRVVGTDQVGLVVHRSARTQPGKDAHNATPSRVPGQVYLCLPLKRVVIPIVPRAAWGRRSPPITSRASPDGRVWRVRRTGGTMDTGRLRWPGPFSDGRAWCGGRDACRGEP
jgi:primary-amine oxidase